MQNESAEIDARGLVGGLVIGFDAGGTTVRARLTTTAGEVLADRFASADEDGGALGAVSLLRGLLPSAATRDSVVAVCAGITKITRAGVRDVWESALARALPNARVRVVPDYEIAFHGAIREGIGVAVTSGTGSVAYGVNGAGIGLRVGGRGWEYGDEGSGGWLTTEMIRRTLRALDGLQAATPLTEAICGALGTRDAAELGEAARTRSVTEGRGFLIPLTLGLARAGNEESAGLFKGTGGWLALLARVTAARLGMAGADAETTFTLVGGLATEASDFIAPSFATVLLRNLPAARIVKPDGPPLEGAVRLACRLATRTGNAIDSAVDD